MAMDTSALPYPKPRPAALERQDRRKALKTRDEKESDKVKVRSGGRCEVVEVGGGRPWPTRCVSGAVHVMHLIGGRGKRGRGISALAIHKLHGCATHHREIDGGIGGKKLIRIGGSVPRWDDTYRRAR